MSQIDGSAEREERNLSTLTTIEIAELSNERKLELGQLVSNALAEHPDTMLQHSAEEVAQILREGRAVIVVDPHTQELAGFAQLFPWHTGEGIIGAIEFRGWLSRRSGVGAQVLHSAVNLSRDRYPGIGVYAIIEETNQRAQQIALEHGAFEVPLPDAISIELTASDKPAAVRAFDLGRITA